MTDVNLTITGEVEVLRLKPGDTLVVTFARNLTADQSYQVRETLRQKFPDNQVLVAGDGAHFGVLSP